MKKISEAKKIMRDIDEITVIDFTKTINDIKNLNELPSVVQDEIKNAEHIEGRGYQKLLGFNGNQIIWSAGGHWVDNETKFEITSFGNGTGSNSLQWSK